MTELDVPAGEIPRRVRPTLIPIDRHVVDASSDAAELAARVSQVARGGVRAAVLGVNDGLVTNVCLILAVAGANASPPTSASPGSPVSSPVVFDGRG